MWSPVYFLFSFFSQIDIQTPSDRDLNYLLIYINILKEFKYIQYILKEPTESSYRKNEQVNMHFVYITWLYWLLGISLFLLSSTIASIARLSQPLSILQSIQSVHRIASLFITLFYCLFWRMLTFGEQSNK